MVKSLTSPRALPAFAAIVATLPSRLANPSRGGLSKLFHVIIFSFLTVCLWCHHYLIGQSLHLPCLLHQVLLKALKLGISSNIVPSLNLFHQEITFLSWGPPRKRWRRRKWRRASVKVERRQRGWCHPARTSCNFGWCRNQVDKPKCSCDSWIACIAPTHVKDCQEGQPWLQYDRLELIKSKLL